LLNWIYGFGLLARRSLAKKERTGLVQVFTGDGKGKTTAALGTVLRAAGHGFKILVIFFIKGESSDGEFKMLPTLPGVEIAKFGMHKWIRDTNNVSPEEKAEAAAALEAAHKAITSGKYDLVVLDEINMAVYFKLITADDVIKLAKDKPAHTELILTGRRADSRIIEIADLVTEMKSIKHPYEKGISAREGIEY
jgi:cob(I)alamin adenosyltransferase